MRLRAARMVLVLFILLAGCDPVPVQYPPGTPPYPSTYPTTQGPSQGAVLPSPGTPSSPQMPSSQRTQYVLDKMMEGVVMGGAVAGPFGSGGGLIIGLIAGLLTADSHYAQLNAQTQAEQAKDKELEAQIERELEHQRELAAQLGKDGEVSEPRQREEVRLAQRATKETKMDKKEDLRSLASLGRKEIYRPSPSNPFKNVEIRDINQDRVPDLWIYYNPLKPQEIVRQEEDTNGDGRVDTWSAFKDGKLVRREVDTKGNGRPDTIYYYEDDKISREERDENGDGRPSFRAAYQNGRLAKVEKDLDRDGKIDLWIYYDTTKDVEVVVKEERDLNGDGAIDLWSYYENARLVRKDVSAVGLQHLSEQENPPPEAPSPALPKS
ncbi:MAG: hypothetical protein HY694_04195 [Deltaproteobacteria bacterium]|nr:hypothetical protein [Deltaproteobacteria bacterium]